MFESTYSPGIAAADTPPETEDVLIRVGPHVPTHGPFVTHRYELNDAASWMEMVADITLPTRVGGLRGYSFTVKVLSVGSSLQDEDAAEDFHLVLKGIKTGKTVRLDLEPRCAVGGTGSSRKPKQPPVELSANWHLPDDGDEGAYTVSFGFRYTDDSHKDTRLRPRLDKLTWGTVCRTHMANLLFARHMQAKPIYLGYEAAKKGWENVQELALAEMAAFSGGGGFAGRGEPQAKYRAFFKRHADLFDGWEPTAPAAVLYSYWGPNPLNAYKPWPETTIADYYAATHCPFVVLVDKTLPQEAEKLAAFQVIDLPSPAYEMSETQLAALRGYVKAGGCVALRNEKATINGGPAPPFTEQTKGSLRTYDWRELMAPTTPVAAADGLRKNLRFALYRKGDRLALHAVNYNVCLLDPAKKVLEVEPTELQVPLPADWKAAQATCFDPDAEPQALQCRVAGGAANLTLPRTHVYKVVLIQRKGG
jgi:hypothetical protein